MKHLLVRLAVCCPCYRSFDTWYVFLLSGDWVLQNVRGAAGVLIVFSEKVSTWTQYNFNSQRTNSLLGRRRIPRGWYDIVSDCIVLSISTYSYTTAGPSLKVVSTMSVGYGMHLLFVLFVRPLSLILILILMPHFINHHFSSFLIFSVHMMILPSS